jgi:hypothetical protein
MGGSMLKLMPTQMVMMLSLMEEAENVGSFDGPGGGLLRIPESMLGLI